MRVYSTSRLSIPVVHNLTMKRQNTLGIETRKPDGFRTLNNKLYGQGIRLLVLSIRQPLGWTHWLHCIAYATSCSYHASRSLKSIVNISQSIRQWFGNSQVWWWESLAPQGIEPVQQFSSYNRRNRQTNWITNFGNLQTYSIIFVPMLLNQQI